MVFNPVLQNYNIYKRIFSDMMNRRDMNKPEAYKSWAELRDMMSDLVSTFL